jgi:hypothetical protein
MLLGRQELWNTPDNFMFKTRQKSREKVIKRSKQNDVATLHLFVYTASFCGISFVAVWISTICFI